MSDISPRKDDSYKTETIIAGIVFIAVLLGIFALIGWGFFEVIKAISHAWHEGAK